MKNVIAFPENRMRRMKRLQAKGAQQAMVSLSLVSLLMGALLLNDSMTRNQGQSYLTADNTTSSQIKGLNRVIASAQPMNPLRDLEWEKKLAERLGQDTLADRSPAAIGKTANGLDQLRFGPLQGKYDLVAQPQQTTGRVQEITYMDSDEVTARPIALNPDQFLTQYGNLLSVDFAKFERANNPSQEQIREYRLINGSGTVVGTAAFVMNEENELISLKIRSALAESK